VTIPRDAVHEGKRHWPLTDTPLGWRAGNIRVPFVIHLRETHNNRESQKNLSRTIVALAEKTPDLLLCAEGAWGRVSFDRFERIADRRRRGAFADALRDRGLLTGEEHALASGAVRASLWGVEDPRLHAANTLAQANTRRLARRYLPRLKRLHTAHTIRLQAAISPSLRDFREFRARREAGRLDLTTYVEGLLARLPSAERAQFPRFNPLLTLKAARLEADAQRTRGGSARDAEELNQILRRVHGALAMLGGATSEGMATELQRLERRVESTLRAGASPAVREALDKERWLEQIMGLWTLALTPDQWEDYRAKRDASPDPLGFLERADRRHPEAFYELAQRRDAVMAENVKRLLNARGAGTAALATGGFHGRGIETRLEAFGYNYGTLYIDASPPAGVLRRASALVSPTPGQLREIAQIADRILPPAEAAVFRRRGGVWIGLAIAAVGLMVSAPALAGNWAGILPPLPGDALWSTAAGWAGISVLLDDNGRLLSWRSRLQDLMPPRRRKSPPPLDESSIQDLTEKLRMALPEERIPLLKRAIVESPARAAGAVFSLPLNDAKTLIGESDAKFRGDLLHGLDAWAQHVYRRQCEGWRDLSKTLGTTANANTPSWPERKAALEKTLKEQIGALDAYHRDLGALRWAHASPVPRDRASKENPIEVAAGVFSRALATRRKLLESISAAPSAAAAVTAVANHRDALTAETKDFQTQISALDADRLGSPLVPRYYRSWAKVVARLGSDPLKDLFLTRPAENGDVLSAFGAGDGIEAAVAAGWLEIIDPAPTDVEKAAPFARDLETWSVHAQNPLPSKWGLAVWPNDLSKMDFAGPLAARLAEGETPRRLYRLKSSRLFGDHNRQTEVSKALAQLMQQLNDQGHAVLLMDLDIYQTENQDVLQRAMNEWKKLPAPPPVIGVCTELTHKMRLETKTRALFDPVLAVEDTDAIDRRTVLDRVAGMMERLRFRWDLSAEAVHALVERARTHTGFARGDFTARWVDRAVSRAWRRLLRVRESRDPFELTEDDLESVLRTRAPDRLRPLRDRIANVLPLLTDAQRRDLLREFNDMANPSVSRQESQKIRLWIEEFIEIHSLPPAAAALAGNDAATSAPVLYERARHVFARSHFGMDAVVAQVEGILTKIIQSERKDILPESDFIGLIGPPGVGKTSILLLIGEALGRPVKIISGTKIQTEEDLKGFLRTYVNSHSGELANALRSGPPEERVRNPILVIDEVDKIPPAIQAILLQVLDPAQNRHFEDFYLGEIDLSGVEIVLTGNDAGRIIEPLKNRMHIETLKGYTEAEKIQIAARFMLPKLLAEFGLGMALRFPRAGETLAHLIREHDHEQGVRELERLLERVVLFAAKRWALNGRRAPVDVDIALVDACLGTPSRNRIPLPPVDTVGLAHFPASTGWAFAIETGRDPGPRGQRREIRRAAAETPLNELIQGGLRTRLRWLDRFARLIRFGNNASPLPPSGDGETAIVLKEVFELAGRLVSPKRADTWITAAPRSGTPPDPAAGLAAVVSIASADLDRPVKRETVFLGALSNRGQLLPVSDFDRRLFGAIDAGAAEIVLPRAHQADVESLASGGIGLRGPILILSENGKAALRLPLPRPNAMSTEGSPAWTTFVARARQHPHFESEDPQFLVFSGPLESLRSLARESLDASDQPQTIYLLCARWDDALPLAFRTPGEPPLFRRPSRYGDTVSVQPLEKPAAASREKPIEGGIDQETPADRTVLFVNDNYRRRMITEPAVLIANDLFETVMTNFDPSKIPSAEAVLRSSLAYNPAIAARFFIKLIDLWRTGDRLPPEQRRAVIETFRALSPDTVGSLMLASAQFGVDTILQRMRGGAQDLTKALAAPGNKGAAAAALANFRLAFQSETAEGALPHPVDEFAKRLEDWDPARSPAAPTDLVLSAEALSRRVLLFVHTMEQANRAPLSDPESAARDDLKIQFPDYANSSVHELFALAGRSLDDLSDALAVYAAGRLLEDTEDLGFVTEHRPRSPLDHPEDDLLDPVLRDAALAVSQQMTTSALRHTVILSCPDNLRAAVPDYLARFLWREGLPRRVLRLNTLNLQMANTEFADDTAFAWRRMQRVIHSAARQGNCALVIDLDEFQKNVPAMRHAIDMGRILAVANDSQKPLPIVFLGSEAAHLRFQEAVTAYGEQVVPFSMATAPPGPILRAQVGRMERARGRPVFAPGVLARVIQDIHNRSLGLRGALRLIERLSASPAPLDMPTFQQERDAVETEDRHHSKDRSIEQRFELESYRLPPGVRAEAEKMLSLWVSSSGDEAAKLEHRLRLILDFPYPVVPSADQIAQDARTLLDKLPDTLRRLRETLDAEFYGMDEVKDRIEDFVSRTLLSRAAGAPPRGKGLLLVGPPGTAKTTMVLAISEALGIPMTNVPCGAVKDSQYFVGFDSGFLGSKIGKLCEASIRMGVPNAIFLLDEIEKMRLNESGQHPGDVFLQILDPKQNTRVREKFLGVDTDYSQNLFIATANGLTGIPAPLLDRFDVVTLTGYNKSAKTAIAQKLVRRLIQKWRIEDDVRTPDLAGVIDAAVEKTHTQEKGVRQLGKALNTIYKAALTEKFKRGLTTSIEVTPEFARQALRIAPLGTTDDRPLWAVGRVQGLAVMSGEGEEGRVLDIEADLLPAPDPEHPLRVVTAGLAKELMAFSQQTALPAALGWIERNGGLPADAFRGRLLSLLVLPWHVPKDGDSAGAAFTLALLSALTDRPLRQDFAITGAISRGGLLQRVGGIGDKVTKAQQIAKMVFLPKENENDLLTHLLKSPDQIHFVESRAPGGAWTRTLHVIPRAFTNAGLPATAVEDFVRDAKDSGLTVSHEPTFKANEWIKISGEPTAVAAFFETHRGVLETPPLHVLADRIEDVVERVLSDSPNASDPGSPSTPPGSKGRLRSFLAAGLLGLTSLAHQAAAHVPLKPALDGSVAVVGSVFAPLRQARSVFDAAHQWESTSFPSDQKVLTALSALAPLAGNATSAFSNDLKTTLAQLSPESEERTFQQLSQTVESAVFDANLRGAQSQALVALANPGWRGRARANREPPAVPVLTLDWNSVLTAEGRGLLDVAASFLAQAPQARVVLAGSFAQQSAMEKSLAAGPLSLNASRILIYGALPEEGGVNTESVKEWVRERLRATGALGDGDLRFRLGATADNARRWTGLLKSLLIVSQTVTVPADLWKQLKPRLQGDLGIDNPDGSHTLPAREYSLADLLKSVAEDVLIQTQA